MVCAELDPSLERYAFLRIDRRLVSEANTADMLRIQTPTCHVKAETASAVHQRIRALLGWVIAMNLRNHNSLRPRAALLGPQNDIRRTTS